MNTYFDWPASFSRFIRFDTVRSADANDALDAVSAGFDMMPIPAALWGNSANYVAAGGSVNAWTASLASTYLTAHAQGLQLRVKFAAANTTTTPTLNLNGLGAKVITRADGTALNAGDIEAGATVTLTYDTSGSGTWRVATASVASSAANVSFAQTGTGAVTTTLESNERNWIMVTQFAANGSSGAAVDPTGTVESSGGIQAAINEAHARGDTSGNGSFVLVPPGDYSITTPIWVRQGVTLLGFGGRAATFLYTGSTPAKGVVYVAEGTDMSPSFVFSTQIENIGINCGGVSASVGLYVRGVQENCVFHQIAISRFTAKGLEVSAFSSINHKARFSVMHIIPEAGATTAVGADIDDAQGCEFTQLATTSISGNSFSKGLYFRAGCGWNLIKAHYYEDATIGIQEESGAINIYEGLEGNCLTITGTTHFYSTNARHAIRGMRSVSGITNHYVGPSLTIPGGSAVDTVDLVSSDNGIEAHGSYGIYRIYTITSEMVRGVTSRAGSSGNGVTALYINDAVPTLSKRRVLVNLGSGAAVRSFAGKLSVYGVGDTRVSFDYHFGGAALADGTVTGAGGTSVGYQTNYFTVTGPLALATPVPGWFAIQLEDLAGVTQSVEYRIEMSRQDGNPTAIGVAAGV